MQSWHAVFTWVPAPAASRAGEGGVGFWPMAREASTPFFQARSSKLAGAKNLDQV